MDFANERYVRLYTRNTTSWKRLGWEGQCVLMQLLRVVDRAGVLDIADMDPASAVSLHTDMPIDIVRAGIARALELGSVDHRDGALVLPNYLEAQECAQTDKQRKRESRERRRDMAKAKPEVTNRDEMSRSVTDGHAESQSVTLSRAEPNQPCRAVPSRSEQDGDTRAPERSDRFEKPPVGEAPANTQASEPKRTPWIQAFRVAEKISGREGQLGHPERHREWAQSLACAAQTDCGCDGGAKFENAVEAIVRAWLADPYVVKNSPPISNLQRFLEKPRAKPVVKLVPESKRLTDAELLALDPRDEWQLEYFQKMRRWELVQRQERREAERAASGGSS